MTFRSIAALAAVALLTVAPAGAATFTFTSLLPLFPTGSVHGFGTITAADTVSTGFDGSYTGLLVSAITGTYDGANILGLVPTNTLGANDNLVSTSNGLVDFDGIAFLVDAVLPDYHPTNGYATTVVNFYRILSGPYTDNGPTLDGTFTLTAVPEPASWAMMLVGLGGVGYALRARRTRVVAA